MPLFIGIPLAIALFLLPAWGFIVRYRRDRKAAKLEVAKKGAQATNPPPHPPPAPSHSSGHEHDSGTHDHNNHHAHSGSKWGWARFCRIAAYIIVCTTLVLWGYHYFTNKPRPVRSYLEREWVLTIRYPQGGQLITPQRCKVVQITHEMVQFKYRVAGEDWCTFTHVFSAGADTPNPYGVWFSNEFRGTFQIDNWERPLAHFLNWRSGPITGKFWDHQQDPKDPKSQMYLWTLSMPEL